MFQGKEKKWQQTDTMQKNALPSTLNFTAHNNKIGKNYGKQRKSQTKHACTASIYDVRMFVNMHS